MSKGLMFRSNKEFEKVLNGNDITDYVVISKEKKGMVVYGVTCYEYYLDIDFKTGKCNRVNKHILNGKEQYFNVTKNFSLSYSYCGWDFKLVKLTEEEKRLWVIRVILENLGGTDE